jgi:hypothetical protein
MAEGEFSLDQALSRVVDQFNVLKYLHEQNPAEVLSWPADKTIVDLFKAVQPHIPATDPVAEVLNLFIMEYQNKAPKPKISQVLPMIMALQGALQDEVDKRDGGRPRQAGSGGGSPRRKPQPGHSNRPTLPPPPQYRSDIFIGDQIS